jgi:hypothetical protein
MINGTIPTTNPIRVHESDEYYVVSNKIKKIEKIVLERFRVDYEDQLNEYIAVWIKSEKAKWAITHSVIPIRYQCCINPGTFSIECVIATKVFGEFATYYWLKWGNNN